MVDTTQFKMLSPTGMGTIDPKRESMGDVFINWIRKNDLYGLTLNLSKKIFEIQTCIEDYNDPDDLELTQSIHFLSYDGIEQESLTTDYNPLTASEWSKFVVGHDKTGFTSRCIQKNRLCSERSDLILTPLDRTDPIGQMVRECRRPQWSAYGYVNTAMFNLNPHGSLICVGGHHERANCLVYGVDQSSDWNRVQSKLLESKQGFVKREGMSPNQNP